MSDSINNHPAIKSRLVTESEKKHKLTIEPLIPGFGYTIGNSLRRVLLSAIPGFAVTKIKINDITHEYQVIDGVVEDAIEVILNLKLLRVKILNDDEKVTLVLTKSVDGDIFASDFETNGKVQIINPELFICSLDKNSNITIEIEITRGIGYLSNEQIKFADNANPFDIFVDALFSPVSNVSLNVEQVRVGDKTNFDKVEITFDIDKTVEAPDIVNYALDLIVDMLKNIKSSLGTEVVLSADTKGEKSIDNSVITKSNDIDLPKKITNILVKNNIHDNDQLIDRIKDISDFPGITEKSMILINDYIETLK